MARAHHDRGGRPGGPGLEPGEGVLSLEARRLAKLDLVNYYLEVADAALNHLRNRPTVLKRFVNGAGEKPFFQKRIPDSAPDWLQTATVTFPSGRDRPRELVAQRAPAHLIWRRRTSGVIGLEPVAVPAQPDLDHPDELRVDLDPTPEASFASTSAESALCRPARCSPRDHGLTGFPKTSGSRGIHINVRIHPRWDFFEVRRAAVALAREVERRAPDIASSKWWKEERHGVFIDYNQNARDRTVASAYSVRPTPDARVSTPLDWDEVADVEPEELRIDNPCQPGSRRKSADPSADIDAHSRPLDRSPRAGAGSTRRTGLA